MKFIKKLFINSWIRYLVSFVIGLIIAVIYLSLNGFKYFYNYVNAISTAGISLIFIGLLSLVSYLGAFYAFGYGFSQIFGNKSNYKDLYDYTTRKIEIRKGIINYGSADRVQNLSCDRAGRFRQYGRLLYAGHHPVCPLPGRRRPASAGRYQ